MSTPPGGPGPHIIKQLRERFRMGEWVLDAACTPNNAYLFDVDTKQKAERAIEICATCPVIEQCRAYALGSPDRLYGVWGGLSEPEIENAHKGRTYIPDACGSPAGYKRHIRAGQVPCWSCRRAESRKRSETRRKKREEARA